MEKVLYEVSFRFEPMTLIPVVMLVILLALPKIIQKSYQDKNVALNMKFIKVFCLCCGFFIVCFSAIAFLFQFYMYKKTVGAYRRGAYETVEGYVENFHPMPYAGHDRESFEIDGVKFFYSDYNIITGYHNTRSHGGVITGEGQHLKIGYVYFNRSYGNVIVYIGQLPQD